jgi:hypothetical protein
VSTGRAKREIVRRYLTDAFFIQPPAGWQKRADLRMRLPAAPALQYGNSHILIFGGDDGENAGKSPSCKTTIRAFQQYPCLSQHHRHLGKGGEWPGKTGHHLPQSGSTAAEQFPAARSPWPSQRMQSTLLPQSADDPFGTINFMVLAIYLLTLFAV